MKTPLYLKSLSLFLVFLLQSCGGGSGGSSNASQNPVQSSIQTPESDFVVPASGITVASQSNALVVEKVFKPGVFLFTDKSGNIQKTGEQEFLIRTIPSEFKVGSVFTYADRPYVVENVVPGSGVSSLMTRFANIDEVLVDLKLHGQVSMDSLDLANMAIDGDDNSPESRSLSPSKSPITKSLKLAGIPISLKGCSANTNLASTNSGSYAKCAISYKSTNFKNSGLDITYTGEAGVKDINFNLVWEYLSKKRDIKDVKGNITLLGEAALSTTGEQSISTILEVNEKLSRFRFPIQQVLGFIRVDFPMYFTAQIPLLKLAIGLQVDVPFSGTSLRISETKASLKAPVFGFTFPGTFTNEVKDVFIGAKVGPVIALSPLPSFSPSFAGVWDDNEYATLDVVGVMGKLGLIGDLKFKINPTNKTQCVDYGIQPAAGVSIDSDFSKLLGPKDASFFKLLTPLDIWKITRVDECTSPPPPAPPTSAPTPTNPTPITSTPTTPINSPLISSYSLSYNIATYELKNSDGAHVGTGASVTGSVSCVANCTVVSSAGYWLACGYTAYDIANKKYINPETGHTTYFYFSGPPNTGNAQKLESLGVDISIVGCSETRAF